jgi:adenylate cyclase
MSIYEIERKFLVRELPELGMGEGLSLKQGYLAIDEERLLSVRIRQEGGEFRLTIKQGRGRKRVEIERAITETEFSALWPSVLGGLSKTRFRLLHDRFVIEIDVFEDSLDGLVLAEVEFTSEDSAEAFQPPDWFGEDVTEDPRYLNQTLALKGLTLK